MTNNTTAYINQNATDSHYVVYRSMRATPEEVLTIVATSKGAKMSLSKRTRAGEFEGWDEYGFYLEEKIDGRWIKH